MKLAERSAICETLKPRGQDPKEVDQKTHRRQTRRQTTDSADNINVVVLERGLAVISQPPNT
jgi:hypothetical protein